MEGYSFEEGQLQSVTKFLGTVHDNTYLKLSRLRLSLAMLFACKFLSPFAKTTLWEGKVLQSVSTILSEAVAKQRSRAKNTDHGMQRVI